MPSEPKSPTQPMQSSIKSNNKVTPLPEMHAHESTGFNEINKKMVTKRDGSQEAFDP